MDELAPVRSSAPFGPVSRLLGGLALVGLIAAIAKPWGSAPVDLAGASPTAAPTDALSATPAAILDPAGYGSLRYDPSVFGAHEPAPAWGLLPASFLVTFGFVMEVPDAGAGPTPGPTASSAGGSPPSATNPPSPAVVRDGGPNWPAQLLVPEGYHLFLVGINMPLGTTLESATLTSSEPTPTRSFPLSSLPSPWPSHFAVLGVVAASGGLLKVWTPATYRLALSFSPGAISRSIVVVIPTLPGAG